MHISIRWKTYADLGAGAPSRRRGNHKSARRDGCKVRKAFVVDAAMCFAALTFDASRGEPAAAPLVLGAVHNRLVLDGELLKSLPAVTINVTFETGEGKKCCCGR